MITLLFLDMNKLKVFLSICCISTLLTGCFFGKKESSDKTGWKYNDPKYGGVEKVKAKDQKTAPGLVFIQGGVFIMGQVGAAVGFEWNNQARRVTLDSYYIYETEVTNQQYRDYLFWLGKIYTSFPNVLRNALPDTLVWRLPLAYNEPYVEAYFRHPGYNDYPVVGVSWLQANDYCLWRTDRVNELMLIEKGILNPNTTEQENAENFNTDAYLAGQYEGDVKKPLKDIATGEDRRVKFEDGILFPKYRLPTEAEFEYAAAGLIGSTQDERVLERRLYGWSGTNVRNSSKKQRGNMMANFQRGRGDLMGVAGSLNSKFASPGPVRSFPPNAYGLYDMVGNVSEWVLDIYRPLSFAEVEEFNPYRGNVFTERAKDPEGNALPKDELGRMRVDTVGVVDRYNYQMGDNRNYRDGDIYSSIFYQDAANRLPDSVANSTYMYYQGDPAKSNDGMSSLVSDKSRVYKGGSFLDRPYWLRPATRRFLAQDRAAVDIGFRCAMISVGGEVKIKGSKKKKK